MTSPDSQAPQRRPIYKDFTVLQLGLLVFLLDQFTKFLVIQLLSPGASFPYRGFFRFTHVHNTGSAFGIFQGLNTPLIFVSFIGIIILVLIYRSQPRPSNLLRLSLALQLGGAFGNLVDRVRLGFVTDFIDIGPWPVFNLADASIVTGLVLLAWVFTRGNQPREEPDPSPQGAEAWDTSYNDAGVESPHSGDDPYAQTTSEDASGGADGTGDQSLLDDAEAEIPSEREPR